MESSSTSKRRRSEISEALEESFASIDVDAGGAAVKKGAAPGSGRLLVRDDREEDEAEDWAYKVSRWRPTAANCQLKGGAPNKSVRFLGRSLAEPRTTWPSNGICSISL